MTAPPREYGCHCDIEAMPDGFEPDGCVFDGGLISECTYAIRLQREGKGRDDCEYWRPIVRAPAPSAHQTARFDLAWLISAINVHRHLPRPVGPELPKWYAENDRWLREASEMLNKIYSAENTPGSAAQPAEPTRHPCGHLIVSDACVVCAQPAEPPATDDLVAELRATHCSNDGLHDSAANAIAVLRAKLQHAEWQADIEFKRAEQSADTIERQAREIADLTRLQERNEGRIKGLFGLICGNSRHMIGP